MKRVKVLVSMSGRTFNVTEGEVIDWPDGRADHFLKAGYVEFVEDLNPKPKRKPRKK